MTDSAKLSILIVDDEPAIRMLVHRYLEDNAFEVAVAPGPVEALEMAAGLPDLALLVTDVKMPHIEGHELARRLRQRDPDLKVLYLTGYADQLFEAKQQLWDLEAFLEKPFTRESLRQAVTQLAFGRTQL